MAEEDDDDKYNEHVLFETGSRITKDSWECYFCYKPIASIPYMEFDVVSPIYGDRLERRAHCRCFQAEYNRRVKTGKLVLCPNCGHIVRQSLAGPYCSQCYTAFDWDTGEKLRSECCGADVKISTYRAKCAECGSMVSAGSGKKLV